MSPDEDYCPPRESLGGLRRSKRITRSDKKTVPKSKIARKTDEKSAKKSAAKKRRLSPPRKTEESSGSFNGSCLTREELKILIEKFRRDGHFRLIPPSTSPPPFVISRTTNGKTVTTKIECYEPKGKPSSDLATPFTKQSTESVISGQASDPTSIIFCTPMVKHTGLSSISTSTCPRTNNYTQTTLTAQPGADNRFLENSTGSNLHSKSFLATQRNQGNGFGTSSVPSAFSIVNPAMQTHPPRQSLINPMFMSSAPSTWISSASTVEDQNDSDIPGIYLPRNNALSSSSLGNNQVIQVDRNNSKDESHGNLVPQNLPDRYNYSNFDAARSHSTFYSQRESNMQNSTCPLQKPFNSSNEWNATTQISSNVFDASTSTISSNAMPVIQDNTINYELPETIVYNSENRSIDNCMYNVPLESKSLTSNSNGYHSPLIAWNNVKLLPNSYIFTSDQTSYNPYNPSGRCETLTRPMIDEQVSTANEDFFQTNGYGTNDSSPTALNNVPSNTMGIDSNIPGMMTDSEIALSQSSNEQTENLTSSLESLQDFQNSLLCQTVSSGCSFDNDISYDHYMGMDLVYSNENSEATTHGTDFSSTLPGIKNIKTEMRSRCDGDNCQPDVRDAVTYNFDTNNELINSSNYYIKF